MSKSGIYRLSDVLGSVKKNLEAGRIEAILLSSSESLESGEQTAILDDLELSASQIITPIMFFGNSNRFTVGRAKDNNLVLGYASSKDEPNLSKDTIEKFAKISRYHAYFSKSGDGNLYLVDCSSNGVFVNGTRLVKNDPFKLSDFSQIRFGPIVANETVWQFYKPQNFKDYLNLWSKD